MRLSHPFRRVAGREVARLAIAAAVACGGEPAEEPPGPPASDALTRGGSVASDTGSRPHPESVGGLQARRTHTSGLNADLLSARREEGVLAVTIRFRNATRSPLPVPVDTGGGNYRGWTLSASGREWPLLRDPEGDPRATEEIPRTLAPAETFLWRGEFVAPPPSVERFDLSISGVYPFTDVPIAGAPE